jgi:hypothetical protein
MKGGSMDIVSRACFFAHYSEASDKSKNDMILIKERLKDADGNEHPNLRTLYNFERPFYVTRKGAQTHQTKKEYETLENLNVYSSTQARLPFAVARVLDVHHPRPRLRQLSNSPYLYGTDIKPESIIKHQYRTKYPMYQPKATVAALDFETNVWSEDEEIISGAVTFKDKVIYVASETLMGNVPDAVARIEANFDKYLGHYRKERNIKLHVRIVNNDLEVVLLLFKALHKWQPDFVSIWNMSFDINKILDTLKRHNVDPKYVFSDPSVPEVYKRFKWREDNPQKTTATGKTTSKHIADYWHVVEAPASFYIIDSMCYFKRNRVMEGARHSYSLDAILTEELGLTKFKLPEADQYEGLEWHQVMQRDFKIEYATYNIFDCIALELLDEKTNDISKALPAAAGISPIEDIASGPRNLANNLHFFLEEQGKIICSTGETMREDYDGDTIPMTGWIN